eukprot:475926_1
MDESENRITFKNIVQRIGYAISNETIGQFSNPPSRLNSATKEPMIVLIFESGFWSDQQNNTKKTMISFNRSSQTDPLSRVSQRNQTAQQQIQRNVDWSMFCLFCERSASKTMTLRAIFCTNIG